MAKWIQKLQQYNFEIEHRTGKSHGNADALSRRPCHGCRYCERREIDEHKQTEEHCSEEKCGNTKVSQFVRSLTSEKSNDDLCLKRVEQAQNEDPEIRPIVTWMKKSPEKPPWEELSSYSPTVKSYWGQWKSLKMFEGKLYRGGVETGPAMETRWQLIIPKALRKIVWGTTPRKPNHWSFWSDENVSQN